MTVAGFATPESGGPPPLRYPIGTAGRIPAGWPMRRMLSGGVPVDFPALSHPAMCGSAAGNRAQDRVKATFVSQGEYHSAHLILNGATFGLLGIYATPPAL
jgi:hypothetical protein